MSGHTKGPWALDCGFCLPEVLNDRYHAIIAGCGYHVTDDDDGFEITACMNTANARLIAAAPELLEMLLALECDINTMVYCYDKRPENFWRAMAIAKEDAIRARAAIAKAKGEA